MTWLEFSLKDWTRRPLRTSMTALGVAIATATLFSLLAFQSGYRQGLDRELERLGAHILVVPKGCPYDAASIALHGASWPCFLKESYLDAVRGTRGVLAAAPALMAAFYNTQGRAVVYVGIDSVMRSLKKGWSMEGTFPQQPGEILVGSAIARQENWLVGQRVQLPMLHGEAAGVSGILGPTQTSEDTFVYLRLGDAQRVLKHPNEITHILVRLADPNQLDSVVAQLRGCDAGLYMNIVPVAHLFRNIQRLVNSTRLLLGCITLAALLVAAAGVSNALIIAVAERAREIGVMRALGASQFDIFWLFWLETMHLCSVGAVSGIFLALLASRSIETWVRSKLPFVPDGRLLQWEWWMAFGCWAGALVLGAAAAFFPAYRATRIPPVEAFRQKGT